MLVEASTSCLIFHFVDERTKYPIQHQECLYVTSSLSRAGCIAGSDGIRRMFVSFYPILSLTGDPEERGGAATEEECVCVCWCWCYCVPAIVPNMV